MPKPNAIGAIIVSLLIFLTLGHQQAVNAETTFEISKYNKTATAIVGKEELKVKIETGSVEDYASDKNFQLDVGGCVLSINAYRREEVNLEIVQSLSKLGVIGPTSFTALPSQISFEGTSAGKPILCKVKFEKHPDDEKKFSIKVELKGEDKKIPEHLKLILTDPILNQEDKADDFNIWMILGPVIGVVSLILIVGLVVGVVLFRRYKKRKSEEPQQTPTFVLVESAKDKSSKPIQSSASKREIAQSEETKRRKKDQKSMEAKRSKESGNKKQADPPKQQSNCSTVPVKAKSVSSTQLLPKVVPSKAISQPSVEVVSQASVETPIKYVFRDDYLLTKPPSEVAKSQEVVPPPAAAPLLVKEVPKPAAKDPKPSAKDPLLTAESPKLLDRLPAQLERLREQRAQDEQRRKEREEKEAKKSFEEAKKTSEEPKKTSEEQLTLTHATCEEYDFVAEQRRQNERRRKALEAGKLLSEYTQTEGLIDN